MEILQPTKQNKMIANNNNYKISKNKHTIKYTLKLRYVTSI